MQRVLGFLALGLAISLEAAQAAPELGIRDGEVVLKNKGRTKALPADDFIVQAAKIADGSEDDPAGPFYVGIGADAGKPQGLAAGLYLFDAEGRQVAFVADEEADMTGEVRRSPYGRVLAVDKGNSFERSWSFYAWPDMRPLAETAYLVPDQDAPALLWDDDDGALFTIIKSADQSRQCDYESCGLKSVAYLSFTDGKSRTVMAGSDLCDYQLTGWSSSRRTAEVEKLCLPSVKAWRSIPEDASRATVKVRLPRQ